MAKKRVALTVSVIALFLSSYVLVSAEARRVQDSHLFITNVIRITELWDADIVNEVDRQLKDISVDAYSSYVFTKLEELKQKDFLSDEDIAFLIV